MDKQDVLNKYNEKLDVAKVDLARAKSVDAVHVHTMRVRLFEEVLADIVKLSAD